MKKVRSKRQYDQDEYERLCDRRTKHKRQYDEDERGREYDEDELDYLDKYNVRIK